MHDVLMMTMVVLLSVFIFVGTAAMLVGIFRLYKAIRADSKTCKWEPLNKIFSSYSTGCGNDFYNSDETGQPVTSWANHCPYCGGKINHNNLQASNKA